MVGAFFVFRAATGPSAEGTVLLHQEHPVQLGPDGWVAVEQDAGGWFWDRDTEVVMRSLVTGAETNLGRDPQVAYILPSGGYLSGLGGTTIRTPSGEEVASIDPETIGEGVEGLEELQAGFPELAAVSDEVVAVLVCYAPEAELLTSDAAGGHAVMAGFRLSDGRRVWARDTGAGCTGREMYCPPVSELGAVEHVVTYADDQATVTRVDDGTVAATWEDTPKDSVVVQDGLALHRIGNSVVEAVDLATGEVLAATECPDVGLMSPGPVPNLSPEAMLAIECGEQEVRLYDRDAREFTPVPAPPLGEDRTIPDGESRAHDRYILQRTGETVTITDALSGSEIGSFAAPEEMAVQTNAPRGRVMLMYLVTDEDDVQYRMIAADLRTAQPLLTDSRKMGLTWQVDPTGFAMVSSGDFYRTGGRYSSEEEYRVESWVVGVEAATGAG
ncbi:hypothetical protein BF93_11945 [Brachybacterium phenoliresistens]|uniref:Uncharacterized protein n=2 Tax=Brachybacterium phenoliresistens TaxID=396014 RepID=Z9JXD9_9MICO|nr:hypothetical protein BF93_11945 [Brachybacterium phenoliresistens]